MNMRLLVGASVAVLISAVLTVIPWGDPLWRPNWFGMLVLFWALYFPSASVLVVAFVVGLFVDGVVGSLFGSHALGFMMIAYLTVLMHQRLRMFSLMQQLSFVFIIFGICQLMINWSFALRGNAADGFSYLFPAMTSVVLWPFWNVLLEKLHPVKESYH